MGYACPVCAEPQADGEHLANHLAFSAMLGRADHADWLDEHAPEWGDDGPAELAERVTPHANAVELPAVDDDAALPDPPTGAGDPGAAPGGLEDAIARASGPGRERLDPETREVIAEARAMTRMGRGDADDAAPPDDAGNDRGEGQDAGAGDDAGDGPVNDEREGPPEGDDPTDEKR